MIAGVQPCDGDAGAREAGETADRVEIPVPVRHQATGASAGANVHIREADRRAGECYTAKHDRQEARKMLWSHAPSILGQHHPLASDTAEGSDLPESTAGSIQLCQAMPEWQRIE
jgi:hypothetical protein